jgi:hypothetical protein
VLTQELRNAGIDVSDRVGTLVCGATVLAGALQRAGIAKEDGTYMLTACPLQCQHPGGNVSCPMGNFACQSKPEGWPKPFRAERQGDYTSNNQFCSRNLSLGTPAQLDDLYARSLPLSGNLPKGCVRGCVLGIMPWDFLTRQLPWAGKCVGHDAQVWNYQNFPFPRAMYVPGKIVPTTSWFDKKPALLLDYYNSAWWRSVVPFFSTGLVWDYTAYWDELREVPELPGVFLGISYAKPLTIPNPTPFPLTFVRFALFQENEGLVEAALAGMTPE